ncbi:MAG: 16S rRNA (guanine(527)-N(7))-methyltransferase RsmG [Thiotrichales bacterium]
MNVTEPATRVEAWRDPVWRARMREGLQALASTWGDAQIDAAIRYLDLMQRWNAAFNLTAITEPRQMLVQHLFDSLAIAPFVTGPATLDIGTGAGLPGIPLALNAPDADFTLLDSNGKKIRFIRQAVIELRLTNVTIVHTRVADYQPTTAFDCIVSRAYASLRQFVDDARRLCNPGGRLLAMKARLREDELGAIRPDCDFRVEPLKVPGLEAERHLVIIAN